MGAKVLESVVGHLRLTGRRRLLATGIHLSLSLVVFVVALYLILVHWYPGFHFTVDGGWQGVRLMALVDLVLGPALTLLIFNPLKARRLIVFDLSCIGVVQLGALVWGFYAIHSQQPVSVNYSDGTFYSITRAPFEIEKMPLALLDDLSDRDPALVFVRPVETEEELERAGMNELFGGIADYEDPRRFKAFLPNWEAVQAGARPVATLEQERTGFAAALAGMLEEHGGSAADYRYFPFTGRYGECVLAFTAAGELVDAIDCRSF